MTTSPTSLQSLTDEELLTLLQEEREKFSKADDDYMIAIISVLVIRRVYQDTPLTKKWQEEGTENPFFRMVESWGARWHEYGEPLNCPHCQADLRNCDEGPPFKRECGVYRNDRTAYYYCPDCGKPFNRFPKGHVYHMELDQ